MNKPLLIALCVLCMGGCCTCPPPPYADHMNVDWIYPSALATTAITTDSIERVSLDTMNLASHVWRVTPPDDLQLPIRAALATLPPVEPLGPWPCRWVYGTRREPAECPDPPKEVYKMTNGVMEADNTQTVATCLVFHWKDVKDSVWHCGPDDGVFTR